MTSPDTKRRRRSGTKPRASTLLGAQASGGTGDLGPMLIGAAPQAAPPPPGDVGGLAQLQNPATPAPPVTNAGLPGLLAGAQPAAPAAGAPGPPGPSLIQYGKNASGAISIWQGLKEANAAYGALGIDAVKTKPIWYDTGTKRVAATSMSENSPNQREVADKHFWNPFDLYQNFASLAVQSNVHDSKGRPTKEAQTAYNELTSLQKILNSNPSWGRVYETGSFDNATQAALGKAIIQYAGEAKLLSTPENFKDWLRTTAQKAAIASGRNAVAPGPTLMDPAQIREAAQNAALQALGQGLSSTQLDAFVTQFQALQKAHFEDTYTTSTKLPAEALAYVQKTEPGEFASNQQQSYEDALVNLLSGPGAVQRPNIQPTPSVLG